MYIYGDDDDYFSSGRDLERRGVVRDPFTPFFYLSKFFLSLKLFEEPPPNLCVVCTSPPRGYVFMSLFLSCILRAKKRFFPVWESFHGFFFFWENGAVLPHYA